MDAQLPHGKGFALAIATRTSSILSVIGSSIIVVTFIAFPFFRKPINRLVFFATLGNVLTNVATLMSNSVLPKPGHPPSGTCEFQGLLIQWFMVADAFWVLCMATNVFLVFFYGYDARQLRHLEKWYFVFSYGFPGIPALAYIVLGRTGHTIIGSATLWCWVSVDVEWMRIAFFYVPAWIMISAAITVYSVTGYRIWQKTIELHCISRDSNQLATVRLASDVKESAMDEFSETHNIVVTTQIECDIERQRAASRSGTPDPERVSMRSSSSTRMLAKATNAEDPSSGPLLNPSPTKTTRARLDDVEAQLDLHQSPTGRNGYRATIISTSRPATATQEPIVSSTPRPTGKRTAEGHAAAMAYFQVAFLMFLALFVVWLPSSINRMYQFVHKDRPSFALNLISAIVLPLQGAWNATIYIFTTRAECRRAWIMVVDKVTSSRLPYQPRQEYYRKGIMTSSQVTRESVAEADMDTVFERGTQVRQAEAPKTDNVQGDDGHGGHGGHASK